MLLLFFTNCEIDNLRSKLNLSDEEKQALIEYGEVLSIFEMLKEKYEKFEPHQGLKNSQKPKKHANKEDTVIYKSFNL